MSDQIGARERACLRRYRSDTSKVHDPSVGTLYFPRRRFAVTKAAYNREIKNFFLNVRDEFYAASGIEGEEEDQVRRYLFKGKLATSSWKKKISSIEERACCIVISD